MIWPVLFILTCSFFDYKTRIVPNFVIVSFLVLGLPKLNLLKIGLIMFGFILYMASILGPTEFKILAVLTILVHNPIGYLISAKIIEACLQTVCFLQDLHLFKKVGAYIKSNVRWQRMVYYGGLVSFLRINMFFILPSLLFLRQVKKEEYFGFLMLGSSLLILGIYPTMYALGFSICMCLCVPLLKILCALALKEGIGQEGVKIDGIWKWLIKKDGCFREGDPLVSYLAFTLALAFAR